MTTSLRLLAVAALAVATLAGAPALAQSPLEPLDIQTAGGTRHFEVEVMRDDAGRMRGLMFRRDLSPERGMLFQFERNEPIQMWMKNTYLALDMVFFGRDGKVVSVAQNTEPLSERLITSGAPAVSVVEFNAGTAARLGIAPGDTLIFPATRKAN